MGQSAVLEIGNGRMRHLSAVFFLSTFVVSSISIFPDVFAQESETVLQVSGSARFEESDYAGSCKSAVAAARWNAAKLVLSDYIKTSTLAQKSQNIHACFDHRVFSLWLLGRTHLRITRWSLQPLTPARTLGGPSDFYDPCQVTSFYVRLKATFLRTPRVWTLTR